MAYMWCLGSLGVMVLAQSGENSFGLPSWVQNEVDDVTNEASSARQEFGNGFNNLTNSVSDTFNSASVSDITEKAPNMIYGAVDSVENATSDLAGNLQRRSKRAAFEAALTYLGKCPVFRAHVRDVAPHLAPKLAATFQKSMQNPSEEHTCVQLAGLGVDAAISENMHFSSQQEKTVVSWIAQDESTQICNADLMKSLKLFECIRVSLPRQYVAAITDSLLLHVLSTKTLKKELDRVCHTQQQPSQLFSKLPRVDTGTPIHGVHDRPEAMGPRAVLVASFSFVLFMAASTIMRGLPRWIIARCSTSEASSQISSPIKDCDPERGFLGEHVTNGLE